MAVDEKPEALFYHLEHQPLDRVLPTLLEKTRERGWKAVVQSGDEAQLEALDTHLWTYKDDSFLAHGTKKDGHPERQPIYLTTGEENPNSAEVRFFVHGGEASDIAGYVRLVFMFDGRDNSDVQQARGQWKAMRDAGCAVTYWQQDPGGRWVRKA
ncbi:MAG: hypothetical protein RLZ98_805 [Pseudomonadota bacterium]|jgi:DNA polymerase-3 subunit chi